MINNTIFGEVKVNRCSLITMWLEYQKAFDSVPHKWLIKSLEIAKVPTKIISAFKELIKKWATNIHLQGNEQLIETKLIHYLRGIFPGDSLSVLLIILCVNLLSFFSTNCQGTVLAPTVIETKTLQTYSLLTI